MLPKVLRNDQLHKNRLAAIRASYNVLVGTISLEELDVNRRLRAEIRKIKRQIQLIEELNQSFEY
jgi:hypothetical protein